MAAKVIDDKILTAGIVLGGLYVIYQLVQGTKKLGQGVADVAQAAASAASDTARAVGSAGTAVLNTVSGAIAHVYLAATLPPDMKVTGNVALQPGNQRIALANIPGGVTFDQLSDSAVFDYMGTQYLMSGALNGSGDYIAQPVGPSQAAWPVDAVDFGIGSSGW